jgi:hypothetical protein
MNQETASYTCGIPNCAFPCNGFKNGRFTGYTTLGQNITLQGTEQTIQQK